MTFRQPYLWREGFVMGLIVGLFLGVIIVLVGELLWTDSDVIKPLSEEQLELRIEFMDMLRGHLQNIMRQYDDAVEWNRRAREEGEKAKLKQGGKNEN